MTKDILIVLACVPLYVVNSFCDKYISGKNANRYNPLYNCIKFLIGSVCLLPVFLADSLPKFGLGAIICGVTCGLLYAVSKTAILKGYETTSVAFMTLCHSAGMILPCLLGHVFWQEKMSLLSALGILLAVTAIVLLKDNPKENKKLSVKGIGFGIGVFLASGGVMVLQKLMGLYFAGQSVSAYNLYSFVVAALLTGIFVKPQKVPGKDIKTLLLCAAGSAVSLCVISQVMTDLAGKIPSVVLFPLFNGLGIVCVCIGSVFAFRENLTRRKMLGLIIGVLGLCLVNF